MSEQFFSGWDFEHEEQDFKSMMDYQEFCGQKFVYDWSEVRDKIYEESKKYSQWTHKKLPNYKYLQNKTNGCVSISANRTFESQLDFANQKGREVKVFRGLPVWIYAAIHCGIHGRASSGGASLSSAMQAIAKYGVLPQDTPGLPTNIFRDGTYIDGALSWNTSMSQWKEAHEKFGDKAIKLRMVVAMLPRNVEDVAACLKAGYPVNYGTDIKLRLQNGIYVPSGSTAHAMSYDGYYDSQYAGHWNSWGDGHGKVPFTTIKQQMSSRHWQGYVILDVERSDLSRGNETMF